MERTEIIGALGPTNTGKTHRAIERMLDHDSGMMGLPLRLLAREVYDKVVAKTDTESVALITGEERRIPKKPRYWVCTVEAMPIDREVDFLAVDEIQLAAHPERGHVFTDRLLRARGRLETWFMGSDTMAPLVQQLVPTIQIRKFPRLSSLSCEGSYALGSLPPRSAVVAFSSRRVYELAEKLRARKGGAALVLGSLSPRARNAQVRMFQEGDVDYLVATDAIGMGLNLDIDRVAFAEDRKFDGQRLRELELSEMGQIAGRAGRHTRNGCFGTFERPALSRDVVRAIEQSRFPATRKLVWRSAELDFSSGGALLHSLEAHPKLRALELVADPEDTRTLTKLLQREDIRERVQSEETLRLLWDLCQIPDYRQLLVDEHARLVGEIFGKIIAQGRLPFEDVKARLTRLSQHAGDIDTITSRISFVRTWNYVVNHEEWVEDAAALRSMTRRLEDELSDALHGALLERFVARRRTYQKRGGPQSGVALHAGKGDFSQQLRSIHAQLSREEPEGASVDDALAAPHSELEMDFLGNITFHGQLLGNLRGGRTLLEPDAQVADEFASTTRETALLERLRRWTRDELALALGPLSPAVLEGTTPAVRGILYQLRAGWGVSARRDIQPLVVQLTKEEGKTLGAQGIVWGNQSAFVRALMKPAAIQRRTPFVRASLYRDREQDRATVSRFTSPLNLPALSGKPSLLAGPLDASIWRLLGYAKLGEIALRVDLVEKLRTERPTMYRDDFIRRVANVSGLKLPLAARLSSRLGADHHPSKRPRRKRRRKTPPHFPA